MAAKRVLLLGTCGIGKKHIADRIQQWFLDQRRPAIKVMDFEHEFLVKAIQKPYRSFLAEARAVEQFEQWRKGWSGFAEMEGLKGTDTDSREPPDVAELLLFHGAIVYGQYGVRAVYDVDSVAQYQPDLVITLIDDVYDTWWRTEQRAKDHPKRGRPTLEQLLLARRVEQLAGDQIANHVRPTPRHIVLSVHHPTECATRLILGDPRIVYMAFPISEPRRMLKPEPPEKPTERGIEIVNEFHRAAFDFQKQKLDVVFVSPLAIDERPLCDILADDKRCQELATDIVDQETGKKSEGIRFPRDESRWPTDDYWNDTQVLCSGRPDDDTPLLLRQVEDVAGMIRTDVAWRDYRLVLQADALAVFNPVMNNTGRVSGGVQNEIEFASLTDREIYAFQDESEDRKEYFKKDFLRGKTSMGDSPITKGIKVCSSVQALLETASAPEP